MKCVKMWTAVSVVLFVTTFSDLVCAQDQSANKASRVEEAVQSSPDEVSEETQERAIGKTKSLLEESIAKVSKYQTIQADIQHQVTMFGKSVIGKGRYLKGAGDLTMRLELEFDLGEFVEGQGGNRTSFLIMSCDGKQFTVKEDVLGFKREMTIDVQQVVSVLEKRQKQEIQQLILDMMGMFSMGQLLRGINDTMDPEKWVRVLPEEVSFEQVNQQAVYVLEGQWKQVIKSRYLPPEDPDAEPGNQREQPELLPHLPTHAYLTLNRETGFPHRIQYQHVGAGRDKGNRLIQIDFQNPVYGEAIPQTEFFTSIGADAEDMTMNWIEQLDTEGATAPLEELVREGGSALQFLLPEFRPESSGPDQN